MERNITRIIPQKTFEYKSGENQSGAAAHKSLSLKNVSRKDLAPMVSTRLETHHGQCFTNTEKEKIIKLTWSTGDKINTEEDLWKSLSEAIVTVVAARDLKANNILITDLERTQEGNSCDIQGKFENYPIGFDPYRTSKSIEDLKKLLPLQPKAFGILDACRGKWGELSQDFAPAYRKKMIEGRVKNLHKMQKDYQSKKIDLADLEEELAGKKEELEDTRRQLNDIETAGGQDDCLDADGKSSQSAYERNEKLTVQRDELIKETAELKGKITKEKTYLTESKKSMTSAQKTIDTHKEKLEKFIACLDKLNEGLYDEADFVSLSQILKNKEIFPQASLCPFLGINNAQFELLLKYSDIGNVMKELDSYIHSSDKHTGNFKGGIQVTIGINDFTDPMRPDDLQTEDTVDETIELLKMLKKPGPWNYMAVWKDSNTEFKSKICFTEDDILQQCAAQRDVEIESHDGASSLFEGSSDMFDESSSELSSVRGSHIDSDRNNFMRNRIASGKENWDQQQDVALQKIASSSTNGSRMVGEREIDDLNRQLDNQNNNPNTRRQSAYHFNSKNIQSFNGAKAQSKRKQSNLNLGQVKLKSTVKNVQNNDDFVQDFFQFNEGSNDVKE